MTGPADTSREAARALDAVSADMTPEQRQELANQIPSNATSVEQLPEPLQAWLAEHPNPQS